MVIEYPAQLKNPTLESPNQPLLQVNPVINFKSLLCLNFDLRCALKLVDNEISKAVDLNDYEGPRSMNEINALAVPASEIIELSPVALALGFGHAEVIRSNVDSHLAGPDEHPCLDQDAPRWLLSIWDPGDTRTDYVQHLQSSLVFHFSKSLSAQALWAHGATYLALGLQAGRPLILPDVFCPSTEACTEYGGDWSGLGAPIGPDDALCFMQRLAEYNPSRKAIQFAIGQVLVWLNDRSRSITSGEALLREFEAVRPDLGYAPTGVRFWSLPSPAA